MQIGTLKSETFCFRIMECDYDTIICDYGKFYASKQSREPGRGRL